MIEQTSKPFDIAPKYPMAKSVSVIVPVKNEAANIEQLIRGLQAQTSQPAEIVITDGGSEDNTREIIRKLQLKSAIPILLVEDSNAFPGRGRNLAIKNAANDWLACLDAGIVPDPDWLRELILSAEKEPHNTVVFGSYKAITDTYFKECAAISYLRPPGTLTRSIASSLLHRSAWEAVGGFREDLRSGEDLLFFRHLETAGVRSVWSRRALVHWQIEGSTCGTFRRFASYSRYGMKAGLARDWQVSVLCMYFILCLLIATSLILWPMALAPIVILIMRAQRRIYRWHSAEPSLRSSEIVNPRRVLTVTWINLVIDIAMFWGMVAWVSLDLMPFGSGGKGTDGTATYSNL